MATINTVVNNGGSTQAASFTVDTDKIPAMIAKYEDARGEMDRILRVVSNRKGLQPAGNDEVSKAAAEAIKELLGNNPGGITNVVTEARRHIMNQIDQLKAAQQDYRAADEAATPTQM